MIRVNLKLARWLLNLSVLTTGFVYFQRGMSPRSILIPTLAAIVFVNAVFSWAQRSRVRGVLHGVTDSGAEGPMHSRASAKPASLKARLLFLASVGCGGGLGVCYTHETGHWLFIPAGIIVGCVLGQVLLKRYR